jgi:ligand-binding SRPBCC domain-containing protein
VIHRINRVDSAMHTLHREQIVQKSLKTVWDFIQNPANLNVITPDFLDFKIVSNIPSSIYDGLIIEYRIKIPYLGYRQWVAEIKHVREPYSFVDEQRVGPYKFWYHYHELVDTGNGIKMIDSVYYQVPFSILGDMIHFFFIKRILEKIFDYRQNKFSKLLHSG